MSETKKTRAVAIKKESFQLSNPQSMSKLAVMLKEHIKANNLTVNIQGKDYIYVEGWQFAGGMMGLFPKIVSVTKVDTGDAKTFKYTAEAQIINTKDGSVMGTGFALCSNAEGKKKSFDEYAVMSMAQTRAIGKAYRNIIGWVMKMTGYEATPAEEMTVAPAEQRASMVSEVEAKIAVCKSSDVLMEYDAKIKGSKKYSAEDKKHLSAVISARIDALD